MHFLPFSGVVSCDEGSEAGGAETSLFSSFDDSPLGGLWKYSKSGHWNLFKAQSLLVFQIDKEQTVSIQWAA